MQNTTSSLPNVEAIRSGNSLILILGKERIVKSGSPDQIRETHNAVLAYKQKPSQEAFDKVADSIAPTRKALRTDILDIDQLGRVFLSGTKVPLPASLANTVVQYLELELPIEPLVNFWRLSLLNPDTVARDSFFDYVKQFGVTITTSGEVLLYKAVTHKTDKPDFDTDLQAFVGRAMTAIQRRQEPLESYEIYRNTNGEVMVNGGQLVGSGSFFMMPAGYIPERMEIESVGTLAQNAKKIAELETQVRYTDKHTRTMDIRLGVPVWKPRVECDHNPQRDCSNGLHVGAFQYVKSFGSNPDDTILACLVNPMNVVAVPNYDHSKMRVAEYFPYSIMERDPETGAWQEIDSPFFEAQYAPYLAGALQRRMEELQEELGNMDTEMTDAMTLNYEMDDLVQQTVVNLGLQTVEAASLPESSRAPSDSVDDDSISYRTPVAEVYQPTATTSTTDSTTEEDGVWKEADIQTLADVSDELGGVTVRFKRPFDINAVKDDIGSRMYDKLEADYGDLSDENLEMNPFDWNEDEVEVGKNAEIWVGMSVLEVFVPNSEEEDEDEDEDEDYDLGF